MMTAVNQNIFKAYDVRGVYPSEINEDVSNTIARAFVAYLKANRIAVSRDMRVSSSSLAEAFIDGARSQGANVVDHGMMSTDMLYYSVAKGHYDGGAQITASHNPKQYNGLKLVREAAHPLSGDAGISDIRNMILNKSIPDPPNRYGTLSEANVLKDYINHVSSFIDTSIIHPYKLVLDAGNGMAGLVAPPIFDLLPCQTTRLCFDIDGTFPEHEANPLIAENRELLTRHVLTEHADAGIAWDGDADRCFFVDGEGQFIAGDFITTLLAEAFLLRHPSETILYDVRASYAVKDTVKRHGGLALMNRVGHAFFKQRMRDERAVFGGEVTGHYYFRDNFFADNGLIPALMILELMSRKHRTLRELLEPLREKYFISGEINTNIGDIATGRRKMNELSSRYADATVYHLDGVSIEYPDWHFNVRPSNTEPLLRLNLEATTREVMEQKREEILEFIRR